MIERDITLTCVSNDVGGALRRQRPLARHAPRRPAARRPACSPAPTRSSVARSTASSAASPSPTPWTVATRSSPSAMNGEPLPIEHGFPARLVVPGLYGYVSATKWLTEIELTTFADFDHYWLRRGWAQQAPIKLMSRIDTPRGLATIPAGMTCRSPAWRGRRRSASAPSRSTSTTAAWQPAELAEAPTQRHVAPVGATAGTPRPGRHSIVVRATDSTGAIQTDERAEPIPDGASGHHQIVVNVDVTSEHRPREHPRKDPPMSNRRHPHAQQRLRSPRRPHLRRRRLRQMTTTPPPPRRRPPRTEAPAASEPMTTEPMTTEMTDDTMMTEDTMTSDDTMMTEDTMASERDARAVRPGLRQPPDRRVRAASRAWPTTRPPRPPATTPSCRRWSPRSTAAGLVDTLNGDGPFTIFAPANSAFAKIPAGRPRRAAGRPDRCADRHPHDPRRRRLDVQRRPGRGRDGRTASTVT